MGIQKGKAPPRYDEAFRQGAVKLVTEGGRQTPEVARELGISVDTLRSWLKSAGVKAGTANRENREAKRVRELEAQVRDLKRQVGEKDEVIGVLKKSVGIFSKP
jgi:transposase